MTGMVGNDPVQMRQLSALMNRSADHLGTVHNDVARLLKTLAWEGRDGEDFRGAWSSHLAGRLYTAMEVIREAALIVLRNAEDQERASNDLGGGGGRPVSPSMPIAPGGVLPIDSESAFPWFDLSLDVTDKSIGGLAHLLKGSQLADYLLGHGVDLANVSKGLGLFGLGFSGAKFVYDLASGNNRELLSDGVGLALGAAPIAIEAAVDAGLIGAQFTPVGWAIDAVGLGYAVWSVLPPDVQHSIEHGVSVAAQDVAHVAVSGLEYVGHAEVAAAEAVGRGAVEVAGAVGHEAVEVAGAVGKGVSDTANAVGSFVSGGAKAVGHIFGF